MAGWIKISREIANHWLWQDAERLKWWLDLLILAAWEDRRQLVGKQLVSLHKGQLVASMSFLCKRWKRSRTMVEPFLNLLQTEGMIRKEVSNNICIISVQNYDKYQSKNDTYLNGCLNESDSISYTDIEQEEDAYLDAHLDAYLDAHLDAHLDATNKEYKEYIYHQRHQRARENLKFIQELKKSQIWLEQMAMRFHIPIEEVERRLDDFALDCDCRGTTHQDFNDTRKHYNDWLRIQLEAEQRKKKNHVSDRQKQQDKRRGFEVEDASAEDYDASF